MTGVKILVVGSEPTIREVVCYELERRGFDSTAVGDGQTALDLIRIDPPDLLILDVTLPGVDVYEITRQVRATSAIPIILLTGPRDGVNRIIDLELGADDFVVKPFSMRELAARVKGVLRRTQQASTNAGSDHPISVITKASPAKQILVVVDEPRMTRFIKMELDLEGYQTLEATDGFQALEKIRKYEPNLVLLDVEMQGMDGFETLIRLRKLSDIPAIMLTMRSDDEVRIRSLELDADDCLTKPFSSQELASRIRAVLQRTQHTVAPPGGDQQISVGSMRISPRTRQVTVKGEKFGLFPRRILRQLLADYGPALVNEPARVDAFLADLCGQYPRERFLLVQALRERVPADLLSQPQGIAALGPRLTRRLQERYGLSAEAAQWAIESWAMALNIEEMSVPDSGAPATKDVPTDRDVLVAFYHATNGSNWTNSDNWLSDGPLETWYGVTTGSSGRVIELSLSANQLGGTIPRELCNLSNLKTLDLSGHLLRGRGSLSGSIPVELVNLTNLEKLALSDNQLSGSIPPQLGNLSRLEWLILSSNQLSGAIPPQIENLSKLERLILSNNQLSGPIPVELRNLPNLKELDLDEKNQRIGSTSPFRADPANRSTPTERSVPNDRDVLVAFYHATNGSKWRNNENWLSEAPLDTWHGVTTDSSGRVTGLSFPFGKLSGPIPAELGNLSNLTSLRLTWQQLTGPIPPQLGNLSNLTELVLSRNNLTGPIPPQLGNLSNLTELVLSRNNLTGPIPPQLGNLSNLTELSLGGNNLTGPIPPQLGNLSNLTELSLGGNNLTGPIPPQLGNLSNLENLSLWNNELSGSIPAEFAKLSSLDFLSLADNQLGSSIPTELAKLSSLRVLTLLSNQLSGPIPAEFANLSNLTALYLSNNQLSGSIPAEIDDLPKLTRLDLDNNNSIGSVVQDHEGPVRQSVEGTALTDRDALIAFYHAADGANWLYSDNWLSASPLDTWYGVATDKNGRVTYLSLSFGQCAGSIPKELAHLTELRELNLSYNQLEGPIPLGLGSLSNLYALSLSNNDLSGSIPLDLCSLPKLRLLSLNENKLSGSILQHLVISPNLENYLS